MRVAENSELAVSATLGAASAQRMGMADDPALYLTMIISLYPNVKLAFVRETICNQWDAHIAAGCTNVPIQITIDENYMLTFRDFGNGIPVAKMHETYNKLGSSTKRASVKETGGFGLGCKSPIAYAESFKVVTMNNGTMGVYNMVRSSVETDGFPGLVSITQLPTTEHGLEVSIQLDKNDVTEIISYIRSVVFNGSILARFTCDIPNIKQNGLLPTLNMPFEPGSYNVDSNLWYKSHMGYSSIFIRYGNVVYPALETPATQKAIDVLHEFINVIGAERILIQAKPSSLAVTPSRETLSSQKLTEDGITELVVATVNKLEEDIKAGIPTAIQQIKDGILNTDPNDFDITRYVDYSDYIKSSIVRRYMWSSLWEKQRNHYIKEFRNCELDAQANNSVFGSNTKLIQKYRKSLKKAKSGKRLFACAFDAKYLLRPIYKNLAKLGFNKQFSIVLRGTEYKAKGSYNPWKYFSVPVRAYDLVNKRKLAFVTARTKDIANTVREYPGFVDGSYEAINAVVIKVGRKKGESTAAIDKLTKAGWTVVDLTVCNEWDSVAVANREANLRKKSAYTYSSNHAVVTVGKPNRLVSVRALYHNKDIDKRHADSTYGRRHIDVEKPVYYCLLSECNSHRGNISNFVLYKELPEDIKDATVICRNGIEANKAIKRGAVHINEWKKEIVLRIVKDPDFATYVKEHRQLVLPLLHISSIDLKTFALLRINLPKLSKLYYNKKFEMFIYALNYLSAANCYLKEWKNTSVITEEQYQLAYYSNTNRNFTRNKQYAAYIQTLRQVIHAVSGSTNTNQIEYLKQNTQIHSALRTLFKHFLKERLSE